MTEQLSGMENMSKEEILKLLNGLDIRALAAEAEKVRKEGVSKKEPTERKKSAPKWTVTLNDHNDFIIHRTCGNSWKDLVVFTGKGTAYFKSKDGTEAIENRNLSAFLKGCGRIEVPNTWVGHLNEGIDEVKSFIYVLNNQKIMEGHKYGCGPEYNHSYDTNHTWRSDNAYQKWANAWDVHSTLMRKYAGDRQVLNFIVHNPKFVSAMEKRFDMNNLYDFLSSYKQSLVVLDNYYGEISSNFFGEDAYSMYGSGEVLSRIDYEYKAWKEYVLYDAYCFGYGASMNKFFSEWKDSLVMQMEIYGKIKEKYPKNLPLFHNTLSYKYNKLKEQIDEKKFAERVTFQEKLEAKVDGYVFITPRSRQDMLDEAEQQANCLASYVKRVAEGASIIMFMRKKENLDKSCVTIELHRGPRGYNVVQQYQARNHKVTPEQAEVIRKWVAQLNAKEVA